MNNDLDYSITFACYNQVEYTQKCIESLMECGTPLSRVVAVDNGSKDNTRAYLESLNLGGRIFNKDNLGCGVAWNQGTWALQTEWTVIMNNDVLVSKHWIENLIQAAEKQGVRVISPSMVEGSSDYDYRTFFEQSSNLMKDAMRVGYCHAVCLVVHKSVWQEIGYFQPVPKLLGFEDALFFNEMDKYGIKGATTGASWLHHFGSITQSAMKRERGLKQSDDLAYRYNHRLLNQSWLKRKYLKLQRNKNIKNWSLDEISRFGRSMLGEYKNDRFEWK